MSAWKHLSGQVVESRYLLREVLGAGSFALVFRADEIEGGEVMRSVAVKLIYPDPEFPREQQVKELITTIELSHPGIVRGTSAGTINLAGQEWLYLVMEQAQETLEDRLQRGPINPHEAWEITEQIVSALAYLHKDPDRMVHRDIKPANILRFGKKWKLADLGLAYAMGMRARREDSMCGTERYIPPEGFEGLVTPAWDMWSYGVMLAEAMTGKHPFETDKHLFYAITQLEPDLPADLPIPFMDIIRGCLIKRRAMRWGAQQVLTALMSAHGMRATMSALSWTFKHAIKAKPETQPAQKKAAAAVKAQGKS